MFPTRRITTSGGDEFRDEFSLEFDGTNDYVSIGASTTYRNLTAFSIVFWVKRNGYGSTNRNMVFSKDNEIEVAIKDTSSEFTLAVANEFVKFGVELADATWTHVAMNFAGNGGSGNDTRKLYVNGLLAATDSNGSKEDTDASAAGAAIGARDGGGYEMVGKISEVAFWNTTLSANQIKQLYNGREPFDARNVAKSNLVSYWRMGDGVLDHKSKTGLIADQVDATLGAELITNAADREFSSDTSFWTMESGCAISGDAMVFTDVAENAGFNKSGLLTVGKVYQATFDCSAYTDGSFHVAANTITIPPASNNTGSKICYFICAHTTFQIRAGTADSNFHIDNVSVREVNGNGGALINFDSEDFKTDVPK